ncbi:MAG TPA: DUF1501 domain-containing protein [Actinomycetota bacterium]
MTTIDLTPTPDQLPATIEPRKPCGCPDYERGMSRRSFLKRAGLSGLVAGIASQTMFTRLAFASAPYSGDVLIVLSLRGGFDGLNAIVPAADPDYATWRPNVGIPSGILLQLDGMFGMHPAMAPLKGLYDAGQLAVVQAVGMAEPNRSHFQAMEEMERAAPGTSLRTGWLDRVLGLREEGTAFQGVQMGSSMAASAFRGSSSELAMWSVDSFGLDAAWDADELARWSGALRELHQGAPPAIGQPARSALAALTTTAQLQQVGYAPENGAAYPDSDLGRAMRDVARLIKSDVGLQVAAVDYGDWDMHAGMGGVGGGWLHDHLTELSGALAAFATDLGPRLSDVTLVTLTEFGRRVEENGSGGTDHGHGQAVLLLGGGVRGAQVHGQGPGLSPGALVDGDLAATTEYRTILAEILEKRCGAGSVGSIFPGIGSQRLGVVNAR